MRCSDLRGVIQVGNSARYFEDAVIGTRRESQLFDGTLQGLARTDRPAFCFQGHPEASPGPHDIGYLFDRFTALMAEKTHA